jgi:hypothetical protein
MTDVIPKLEGSFDEPYAKNLVMIGDKLLIEVPDGFDIFIMETPTNPVTYGGTLAPCEKGQLIWHRGDVFIACPDRTYVWNQTRFEFTPTTAHPKPEPIPMPIPPMVWGNIIATSGRYALVSKTTPLMLLGSETLAYAGEITASISKGAVEIISSKPPYTSIFRTQAEAKTFDGVVLLKTATGNILVSASGTVKTKSTLKSAVAHGEHGIALTASGKLLGISFSPPAIWRLISSIAPTWHLRFIDNKVFMCPPFAPHISIQVKPKKISIFHFYTSHCREISTGETKTLFQTGKPLTWVNNGKVMKCIPTPAGSRFTDLSKLSPDIINGLMCFTSTPDPLITFPTYWLLAIPTIFVVLKRTRRNKRKHPRERNNRPVRKVWRYGSGGL